MAEGGALQVWNQSVQISETLPQKDWGYGSAPEHPMVQSPAPEKSFDITFNCLVFKASFGNTELKN